MTDANVAGGGSVCKNTSNPVPPQTSGANGTIPPPVPVTIFFVRTELTVILTLVRARTNMVSEKSRSTVNFQHKYKLECNSSGHVLVVVASKYLDDSFDG